MIKQVVMQIKLITIRLVYCRSASLLLHQRESFALPLSAVDRGPSRCMWVQNLLEEHPDSSDLTHVNILAELLIKAQQPQQVLDLINGAAAEMCGDGGVPVELQVLPSPALAGHVIFFCSACSCRWRVSLCCMFTVARDICPCTRMLCVLCKCTGCPSWQTSDRPLCVAPSDSQEQARPISHQCANLGLEEICLAVWQAKAGVCAAQLGDMEQAQHHLAALEDADPADMTDLFLDSADALLQAQCFPQVSPHLMLLMLLTRSGAFQILKAVLQNTAGG